MIHVRTCHQCFTWAFPYVLVHVYVTIFTAGYQRNTISMLQWFEEESHQRRAKEVGNTKTRYFEICTGTVGKVYTEVRQSPREHVTTPCQYRVNGSVPVSTVGLQVFSLNLFLIVIL